MGTGPNHPTEGRKFNLIDPAQTGEAARVEETMRQLREAATQNLGHTTVYEATTPPVEQQPQSQPMGEHEADQLTTVG